MKTAIKIAWRYFRGKKSAQAINIISWISMGAILLSATAMIVLFSVFNGIESVTKDLYAAFYPDLKITANKGKFIDYDVQIIKAIDNLPQVAQLGLSIEDMALISSADYQKVVVVKGVSNEWFGINGLDKFMLEGDSYFEQINDGGIVPAIVGLQIANTLGADVNNVFNEINIFYPKPGAKPGVLYENAFNQVPIITTGIFQVQELLDEKYVLLPIASAIKLLGRKDQISSIELKLKDGVKPTQAKQALYEILGDKAIIQDRYEQNQTLYMILKSEKWAVYAILLMVMLIASFNLIGALSMLVLEKKKDITILKSMGANNQLIRRIFLYAGFILSIIGGLAGIVLGYLLCIGQMTFGWIKLGEGFVVEAYPVALNFADFVLVITTIAVVGFIASWYPSYKAAKNPLVIKED